MNKIIDDLYELPFGRNSSPIQFSNRQVISDAVNDHHQPFNFKKYTNDYEDDNKLMYYQKLINDCESLSCISKSSKSRINPFVSIQSPFNSNIKYLNFQPVLAATNNDHNDDEKQMVSHLLKFLHTLQLSITQIKKFYSQYENFSSWGQSHILFQLDDVINQSCSFVESCTEQQFLLFINQLVDMQKEYTHECFQMLGSAYANIINNTYSFCESKEAPDKATLYKQFQHPSKKTIFCTSEQGHKTRVIALPFSACPQISELNNYTNTKHLWYENVIVPTNVIHVETIFEDHFQYKIYPAQFFNSIINLNYTYKCTKWNISSYNVPHNSMNYVDCSYHDKILRNSNCLPSLYVVDGATNTSVFDDTDIQSLQDNHDNEINNNMILKNSYKKLVKRCLATFEYEYMQTYSMYMPSCHQAQAHLPSDFIKSSSDYMFVMRSYINPYIKFQSVSTTSNHRDKYQYLLNKRHTIDSFANRFQLFRLLNFNRQLIFNIRCQNKFYSNLHLYALYKDQFKHPYIFDLNSSNAVYDYVTGNDPQNSIVHDIEYLSQSLHLYAIPIHTIMFMNKWLPSLRQYLFAQCEDTNSSSVFFDIFEKSNPFVYAFKYDKEVTQEQSRLHSSSFFTRQMFLFPNGWQTLLSYYSQLHHELYLWHYILSKTYYYTKFLQSYTSIPEHVIQYYILPLLSL
jgi:hypothetical protein